MRVCHLVYAYFPADPRVRREVDALVAAGHEVDVICLRGDAEAVTESVEGIRVTRVPLQARRGGRVRYAFQYVLFFLLSSILLLGLYRRRRFQVVHVHSLPDFQVFCAWPLKLRHVRVILDLHEAFPEIVAARFHLRWGSPLIRLAMVVERLSIQFADRVITVNDTIKEVLSKRCGITDEIVVVMNTPDNRVLRIGDVAALRARLRLNSDPTIVYVGGINPERDLGTLLRAVSMLHEHLRIQVVIVGYGDAEYIRSIRDLAAILPLANSVVFLPRIPPEEVLTHLALSSLGVVSYEENPLTQVAIPTKVFEYAAAKRPMVIPRLRALIALFGDHAETYRPGDPPSLASAIERILDNPIRAAEVVERASSILAKHSWQLMESRLLSLYIGLEEAAS